MLERLLCNFTMHAGYPSCVEYAFHLHRKEEHMKEDILSRKLIKTFPNFVISLWLFILIIVCYFINFIVYIFYSRQDGFLKQKKDQCIKNWCNELNLTKLTKKKG